MLIRVNQMTIVKQKQDYQIKSQKENRISESEILCSQYK